MSENDNLTRKPPPTSFYLGDWDETARRKARLDEMAAKRGIKRSVLIQLIADGKIRLADEDGEPPKYVPTYERQPA